MMSMDTHAGGNIRAKLLNPAPAKYKRLTVDETKERIRELKQILAQYGDRDFDSEMAEVIRNGGDVDALEEAQAVYERQGRRLRAELAAREQFLLEAAESKSEGEGTMQDLLVECSALADQIRPVAGQVLDALKVLNAGGREYLRINSQAHGLVHKALHTMHKSGAEIPPGIGGLMCKEIADQIQAFQEIAKALRMNAGSPCSLDYVDYGREIELP